MTAQFVFAIVLISFFHVCVMAACAGALGIGVRAVALGMGPKLLERGRLRVHLLPLGGSVSVTTLAEVIGDTPPKGVLELQPRWKQVLLPLSGPLALLLVGFALLGTAAIGHFTLGFGQILGGAIAPFSDAQTHLQSAAAWIATHGVALIIGVVACKLAALSLIPFLGSNGLHAIFGLLPARAADTRWGEWLKRALLVLLLLIYGGWLLALGFAMVHAL